MAQEPKTIATQRGALLCLSWPVSEPDTRQRIQGRSWTSCVSWGRCFVESLGPAARLAVATLRKAARAESFPPQH